MACSACQRRRETLKALVKDVHRVVKDTNKVLRGMKFREAPRKRAP